MALLQHVYLPYFADDLAERARLVAEMAQALARHAAQGGTPPHAQVLWGLLVLEGRWAEARTLWATRPEDAFRAIAATQIGGIARAQGEPGVGVAARARGLA